jgi:hypothetical protein
MNSDAVAREDVRFEKKTKLDACGRKTFHINFRLSEKLKNAERTCWQPIWKSCAMNVRRLRKSF